jgi:hypothetical protein
MRRSSLIGMDASRRVIVAVLVVGILWPAASGGFEAVDIVSGVIASPNFKDKPPTLKLRLAAEMVRQKRLKPSDLNFILLDWSDQYIRESPDQLSRLKRWAELAGDEQLSHIRIPREFLNRILLAEYLMEATPYPKFSPQKKLEILGKLTKQGLVDWSVSLAYARIYAGAIITGAKSQRCPPPLEMLKGLKQLRDQELIGWHYLVPAEAVLVAEALSMDPDYRKGSAHDRLQKLGKLEEQGLISGLTRRELEKLPAWRLLMQDPSFLKAVPAAKKDQLTSMKDTGLISGPTYTDLLAIFRQVSLISPEEESPAPLPQDK